MQLFIAYGWSFEILIRWTFMSKHFNSLVLYLQVVWIMLGFILGSYTPMQPVINGFLVVSLLNLSISYFILVTHRSTLTYFICMLNMLLQLLQSFWTIPWMRYLVFGLWVFHAGNTCTLWLFSHELQFIFILYQVCNGATYVNIDMIRNKKDESRMLCVEGNQSAFIVVRFQL